ncbi:hemerythrin domain-containing protein [Sphingomonas lutea]|uniref:Hemerythrin domain-containing protein n=1 Tax=Sphingomonas lutea TaxID=1045317 RepID=A0A7G9SFQ3_9SPHN|nr:hemerythrin domain-containing protein [Sphingomonas lutea]QNN66678.1 hemerythrin domain-containing protein [Sphingomonas lutea]
MATRTQNRSSNRTSSRSGASRSTGDKSRSESRSSNSRSAFSWGDNAGPLIGAALAGVVIGVAANFGRKAIMQGMEASAGEWDEILATEHEMALAIFDKMLATDESQTFKRKMLLMKLTHALDKHAHQEEMVVYPALREAGILVEADQLEAEHGEVKTFLYRLQQMGPDAPNWLETVREFRAAVSQHAHMEEEQVFPNFKKDLNEEQDARITSLVNRDGFWMT